MKIRTSYQKKMLTFKFQIITIFIIQIGLKFQLGIQLKNEEFSASMPAYFKKHSFTFSLIIIDWSQRHNQLFKLVQYKSTFTSLFPELTANFKDCISGEIIKNETAAPFKRAIRDWSKRFRLTLKRYPAVNQSHHRNNCSILQMAPKSQKLHNLLSTESFRGAFWNSVCSKKWLFVIMLYGTVPILRSLFGFFQQHFSN